MNLTWRGVFTDPEVHVLRRECFGGSASAHDWWAQVNEHSLGWVCARSGGDLVGWVNVAWDGAGHAFVLDTAVAVTHRRRGIASGLITVAVDESREAGCRWLHVDFVSELAPLYLDACGFRSTAAGLLDLRSPAGARVPEQPS